MCLDPPNYSEHPTGQPEKEINNKIHIWFDFSMDPRTFTWWAPFSSEVLDASSRPNVWQRKYGGHLSVASGPAGDEPAGLGAEWTFWLRWVLRMTLLLNPSMDRLCLEPGKWSDLLLQLFSALFSSNWVIWKIQIQLNVFTLQQVQHRHEIWRRISGERQKMDGWCRWLHKHRRVNVYLRKVCGKNGASLNLQRCSEASGDTLRWKINVNVKSKQINEDTDVKKTIKLATVRLDLWKLCTLTCRKHTWEVLSLRIK